MATTLDLTCPVCNHVSQKEMVTYIRRDLHPQLVEDLLNNKLFLFECDHCGAKRQLETQFIYHDPENAFVIVNYPGLANNKEAAQTAANKFLADTIDKPKEYQLRLVPNLASLIEKIQIFESHLDDRIVEIVKLLTDGLIAKEKPGVQIQRRYFYKPGQDRKLLYVTQDDQLLVDFNDSLLSFASDKFKQATKGTIKGKFEIIDQAYANDLLKDTL